VENEYGVHFQISFPGFYQLIDKERICTDEDQNQPEVQVLCMKLFKNVTYHLKGIIVGN